MEMVKISNLNNENMKEAINFIFEMSKCDDFCGSPKINSIEEAKKLINSAIKQQRDVVIAMDKNVILCIIILNIDGLYIQFDGGIFSNDKTMISQKACLEYIINKYKKCTIDCAQSRSNITNELLEKFNFFVDEDTTIFKTSHSINLGLDSKFEILKEDDYNLYSQFHEKYYKGFYWSFERIRHDIKKWDIYVLKEGYNIIASCFVAVWREDSDEIYGIAADKSYYTTEVLNRILTKIVNKTVDKGKELWIPVEHTEELLEDLCNNLELEINYTYKLYRLNR
jgi:hypothetical protein